METIFMDFYEKNKDEIIKFIAEKPGLFILILIAVILGAILLFALYFFLAWIC